MQFTNRHKCATFLTLESRAAPATRVGIKVHLTPKPNSTSSEAIQLGRERHPCTGDPEIERAMAGGDWRGARARNMTESIFFGVFRNRQPPPRRRAQLVVKWFVLIGAAV